MAVVDRPAGEQTAQVALEEGGLSPLVAEPVQDIRAFAQEGASQVAQLGMTQQEQKAEEGMRFGAASCQEQDHQHHEQGRQGQAEPE